MPTPVIGRIEKDRLVLDFRCLTDEQAFLSNLAHLRNDAAASSKPRPSREFAGRAAVIVGLAGHIDHGKTALVRALTGVDGDRLKEEKARGITIDLGFAYMSMAAGPPIGFIDVPGHERFVHTMLAGAAGIDYAILTIAADDGVKPQTLEHLAILDLLGVDRGVVVLTKADLASHERLGEVDREARAIIRGTTLANARVLAVSAMTEQGVDALRAHLEAASSVASDRSQGTRFRLAVDRVFTLPGVGLVATGTVYSGLVRVGDRVQISPSGLKARIRSLHAQNRAAETARAGDRCALNLTGPGVGKEAIRRGDMVLDPGLHAPTDRIDAILRLLPSEKKPIRQWFPVRLHHGASELSARIVLLGDRPVAPGDGAHVQLVLDRPIAAAAMDRYVIRDASAQRTLGGGVFLDLRPPARKRRTAERQAQRASLAIRDPAASFTALLDAPPFAADLAAFARDRALTAERTDELASTLNLVVLETADSRMALARRQWSEFTSTAVDRIAAYHTENPDLQGMGREELRMALRPRLPKPAFDAALQKLARVNELALEGAFVRLPSHEVRLTAEDMARLGDRRAAARGNGAVPAAAGARHCGGDRSPGGGCSADSETCWPYGVGGRGRARPFLPALDCARDGRDCRRSDRRGRTCRFLRRRVPRSDGERAQSRDPDSRILRSSWRDPAQG